MTTLLQDVANTIFLSVYSIILFVQVFVLERKSFVKMSFITTIFKMYIQTHRFFTLTTHTYMYMNTYKSSIAHIVMLEHLSQ